MNIVPKYNSTEKTLKYLNYIIHTILIILYNNKCSKYVNNN